MPLILHLDTSGDEGLYFLANDGAPVLGAEVRTGKDHASLAMPAIQKLLSGQGLSAGSVDAFALCNGPGSYTGLRVGLASAKGMAYATGKPLILHNKLSLLLEGESQKSKVKSQKPASGGAADDSGGLVAVCIRARAGEWFSEGCGEGGWPAGHYHEGVLLNLLEVAPGAGLALMADEQPEGGWPASAGVVPVPGIDLPHWAMRAHLDYEEGCFADLANSEPCYLKAAFATQPKERAGRSL